MAPMSSTSNRQIRKYGSQVRQGESSLIQLMGTSAHSFTSTAGQKDSTTTRSNRSGLCSKMARSGT